MKTIEQYIAMQVAEALRAENASFDGLRQICPHVEFVRYNSASLFCQNCGAPVDRDALIAAQDAELAEAEAASRARQPVPDDLVTSIHGASEDGEVIPF